jgi:gamma-glutamylputrescine oxidase
MSSLDKRNYYYASAPAAAPFAPLQGDVRADACVIGGGISGLSAALHLRERGYSVVLLEAEHLGFGGSGRSGGQSIFGYACEMSTLEMRDACGTWPAKAWNCSASSSPATGSTATMPPAT